MQFLQVTLDRFNHVPLQHEWNNKIDDGITFSFDLINFHAVEQYTVFKSSNHTFYYLIKFVSSYYHICIILSQFENVLKEM